jgi:hypothetical protein
MTRFSKEYNDLKKFMPTDNVEKNNLWNKFYYQL